jgi:hypothetical protein
LPLIHEGMAASSSAEFATDLDDIMVPQGWLTVDLQFQHSANQLYADILILPTRGCRAKLTRLFVSNGRLLN